jgi:hypothetical protein
MSCTCGHSACKAVRCPLRLTRMRRKWPIGGISECSEWLCSRQLRSTKAVLKPAGWSATRSRFSLDVVQRRSAAALERSIIALNPAERYGRPTELTASTSSCTHVSTHALIGTRVAKVADPPAHRDGVAAVGTLPVRRHRARWILPFGRPLQLIRSTHPHCGTRSTHPPAVGSGTVRRHCETVRTGRRPACLPD